MSFWTDFRDLVTTPFRLAADVVTSGQGAAQPTGIHHTENQGTFGQGVEQVRDQEQLQQLQTTADIRGALQPPPARLIELPGSSGPVIDPATKEGILAPLPPVTLGRLGAAEEQAQRSQLARQLMAEQQAGSRQLLAQQARQGIRGGAAVAQQSQLAQRIAAQRAAQEEQGLLQRTMFNLQQQQREQFANLSSELARRQLGATLAGQEAQVASAREFARAQIAAARD